MIILNSLGILGIILPVIFEIAIVYLFKEKVDVIGYGFLLSSLPLWFIGKAVNHQYSELSYTEGVYQKRHSLFFIHLEYWSIITFAIGSSTVLVMKNVEDPDGYVLLTWALGLCCAIFFQRRKKNTFLRWREENMIQQRSFRYKSNYCFRGQRVY